MPMRVPHKMASPGPFSSIGKATLAASRRAVAGTALSGKSQ